MHLSDSRKAGGPDFLGTIAEETAYRLSVRNQPDPLARKTWCTALERITESSDHARLVEAFDYASAIDYQHKGLSSEAYAAHPTRVGAMCLLADSDPDIDAAVIGLLHNVFEVTELAPAQISERFGESVSDAIAVLTVDRARQWELEYKNSYYEAIEANGRSVCLVKTLDKLDNLFLIGCNPNAGTRQRYMDEIERWVVPIATTASPSIGDYMNRLLQHNREAEKTS